MKFSYAALGSSLASTSDSLRQFCLIERQKSGFETGENGFYKSCRLFMKSSYAALSSSLNSTSDSLVLARK
ncbi:hypothetical protein BB561_003753 [Smittium simulii]|uniref:Uncharacterized protein n=1 Tax=Smittium simulii TaxID=133385 RepID=A0A2T9YJN1_9FUNG|nr:hypothetical protein BB561_003753 [Smittium simulii]